MVCCGSTKDHNGVEIEKFIIHRSWKKYAACFEEPHRRSKQGLGKERAREREDLEQMPLLGSVRGVLWGSWAKTEFVSSNQKQQAVGKCHGDLI